MQEGNSYSQVEQEASYNAGMVDAVRQLIVAEAEKREESLASLSLKLGKNHAYLQQFVKRGVPANLPENVREDLAALLQVDESRLRGERRKPFPPVVRAPSRGYRPPPEFLGDRDLRVFAATEGGPGSMVVSTDPIELVPRPWYLKNVKDGFAILVVGASMEPAFEQGDIAIVNPRLPYARNHDVVLVGREDEGEFVATIKRLLSWTEKEWRLRQFNPRKDFVLPRREWPKALRVVGKHYGG